MGLRMIGAMTFPGPRIPPLLQTLALLAWPFELLERSRRRYGDTFTIRLVGGREYIVIGEPSLVRDVFAGCGAPESLRGGNEEFIPLVGVNSVLVLNGPRHRRHRQLLLRPFRAAALPSHGLAVWETVESTGRDWRRDDVFPLVTLARSIGIAIITAVVFGQRPAAVMQTLRGAIEHLMEVVWGPMLYLTPLQRDLGPWSPGGRVWRAHRQLLALIEQEIATCRREPGEAPDSLVRALVEARDDQGEPMTTDEIRDEIITILLTGHDPTTAATAWMLCAVHQHEAVRDRLCSELEAGPDAPDALAALPYLDAVCQESMRLYPVVPVVERVVREPVPLGDRLVPAGVRLAPCAYLVHRRPDLYPDPEVLHPERFLDRRFAAHEFLPFGGGSRRCIGGLFAPYQMKLVVASLLRRFRFRREPGPVRPVHRGGVVVPGNNVSLRVTESVETGRSTSCCRH
jgi:cytochrome P450